MLFWLLPQYVFSTDVYLTSIEPRLQEQCQAEAQAVANQFNSAYDACIAAYR
jgi:hypothetical protein